MIDTDALVIGAGPTGLFQVFQLGLLGLSAQVVEALPQAGGQCVALYPDKRIHDIPAVPACTGRELTDRLLEQIAPFHAGLHFGHEVTTLQPRDDGRFEVGTTTGPGFLAHSVFIAAGVGAFTPRRIKVAGLDAHEQQQVFHHPDDVARFAGQAVVVVGGDEAALERAATLAEHPTPRVTLLHRRDQFTADASLLDRIAQARADGRLQVVIGQVTGLHEQAGRLDAVAVLTPEGETMRLALDILVVCLGLSPRLGPIADWGLAMERKLLPVNPATFETAVPGLYAVGDINTYPGKQKLILCGFHEATLAAHAAHARLRPQERGPLLYTTSSTLLQRRLGVAT